MIAPAVLRVLPSSHTSVTLMLRPQFVSSMARMPKANRSTLPFSPLQQMQEESLLVIPSITSRSRKVVCSTAVRGHVTEILAVSVLKAKATVTTVCLDQGVVPAAEGPAGVMYPNRHLTISTVMFLDSLQDDHMIVEGAGGDDQASSRTARTETVVPQAPGAEW